MEGGHTDAGTDTDDEWRCRALKPHLLPRMHPSIMLKIIILYNIVHLLVLVLFGLEICVGEASSMTHFPLWFTGKVYMANFDWISKIIKVVLVPNNQA